jgi:Predicted membrane protein
MEKEKGNIIYIFTYILTWITGLIIFLTEWQKNSRIKFHSLQAVFLGITAIVLDLMLFFVPFLGPFLSFLIWVYGMYIAVKAYNGEDIKAPVIGDYAAKYSGYTP